MLFQHRPCDAPWHRKRRTPCLSVALLFGLISLAGRPAGAALPNPPSPAAPAPTANPTAPSSPSPSSSKDRSAKEYQPNIPLVSHEGHALRFYDDVIKGRIVLLNTMFTSCAGICPPMTNNLLAVQKALAPYLGKQVVMVSITVDPQTDTPAVLKSYVERFGIGPGWLFLTGKPTDIDAVLAKIGDADPDKNRHSGMLLVGDDPGKRWRKVPAMSAPKDIAAFVEKLLATRPPPTAPTK